MTKKVGLQSELIKLCSDWLYKTKRSFVYSSHYNSSSISLVNSDTLDINDKKDANFLNRQPSFIESFVTHDNWYKATETLKIEFVKYLLDKNKSKEALSFLSHIRPVFYEASQYVKGISNLLKNYHEDVYLSYFTKLSVLNQAEPSCWVDIIKNCKTETGKEKILNGILQTKKYNEDNKSSEVRYYKMFHPLFKNIKSLNKLFTTIDFGEIVGLIEPIEKKELLQFKINKMKLDSFGLSGGEGIVDYAYKYNQHLTNIFATIGAYGGVSDFKAEVKLVKGVEYLFINIIGKGLEDAFWNSFFNSAHQYIKKIEEVRGVDYLDVFSKIVSSVESQTLNEGVKPLLKNNKFRM